MSRIGWTLVATVAFGLAYSRATPTPERARFSVPPNAASNETSVAAYETSTASSGVTPSVHSASAVELGDGGIFAVWYGGSREGARDVAIYSAIYDPARREWSDESVLTTRADTARELDRTIRKLGNPVLAKDAAGRIWLFYVSVSFGGWSGSAINVKRSDDGARSFGPARRLVTSPFLNVSTLVKGPPIPLSDGGLALPVYHEFIGKFGELLYLDAAGAVNDKARISSGISSLQPVVVPADGSHAVAFLRRSGGSPARVLASTTVDAGRMWGAVAPTSLANPDAAIAAIRTVAGDTLMAFNDSELDRGNLSLALSPDLGESFRVVGSVDPPGAPSSGGAQRLSYPWLLQTRDGDFHLLYTWDRARIEHVRFNRAWLDSR